MFTQKITNTSDTVLLSVDMEGSQDGDSKEDTTSDKSLITVYPKCSCVKS